MTASNPYTNNESNTSWNESQLALARLILSMLEEGYTGGAPNIETEEKDSAVVSRLACHKCGAAPGSLLYAPFTLWREPSETSSYRSFTVCQKCGNTREF